MVILNKKTLAGAIEKHETKDPPEEENNICDDACSCTKKSGCCQKSSQGDDWNENI